MKKTALLRILAIFTFVFSMGFLAQAQTSFKCSNRTTCLLDENGDVKDCSNKKDDTSLFVFNEELTAVTHTTEKNETVYYINESEYDETDNSFTFDVTSENGNDYLFFVFPDDNQIAVLYLDDEGDTWIVLFEINPIY